jgi:site-specific DNA recombinase
MNTAAIYTRKSVYSSRGESIENQIKICKKYLMQQNINEFLIYEDEGFSGKNVNRPQFIKMLEDAKEKKFSILICYRLDRVSRNIADFSSLIENLEKNDISFISVSEQFDTSKPMGRAMMYIASVFSQLERETIAERVRDNMLELARSGRWLGGRVPTGFKSTTLTVFDQNLNERKIFKLSPLKDELDIVKLIFDMYLDKKSISQVVQCLNTKAIKTRMDNSFSKATIIGILTNPVYVRTNSKVFEFLNNKNIETIGTPDGIHGMLSYNKRKGKTGPYRNTCDWICAVAKHEGIISSVSWLDVQKLLKENKRG